jgi:ABC transporter substrate binding protein
MQNVGWIDGENIHLVYRFGGGNLVKIESSAAELVGLSPDLIYAQGLPATRAVHQKTRTIPIVFAQVADPVGFSLVESRLAPRRKRNRLRGLGSVNRRQMDTAAAPDGAGDGAGRRHLQPGYWTLRTALDRVRKSGRRKRRDIY